MFIQTSTFQFLVESIINQYTEKLPYYVIFRFGGRFFALNNCYDRRFRKLGRDVAHEIGMGSSFHEGVYTMLGGPNFGKYKSNRCIYQATDLSFSKVICIKKKVLQLPILFCDGLITETVAELRMLKTCGVDAVGKFFILINY